MSELYALSAEETARRVKAKEVSAIEVARSVLARLDAVNPAINAVIDHRPEDVLAQAAAIDQAIARGEDPGLLAGVPVTIKVNVDQKGYANTNGLRLQKNLIAAEDNPVVANMRKAGALLVGRTNVPAFCLRWFSECAAHGATKNPRNPALTPGGSSGGAAAATTAGIGAIGHGTDIAGSVRYPAYACGIHGLRPGLGRVPQWNPTAAERTIGGQVMSVSGPLARTIGDLRLALEAMSARDVRDTWWVPAPLVGPEVPKRAALCVRPDGMEVVPEVEAALRGAAARLKDAGWTVDEVATPGLREAATIDQRLWIGDPFAGYFETAAKERDPGADAVLAAMREVWKTDSLTLESFAGMLVRKNALLREWLLFFENYPVALIPVSGTLPFPDRADLEGPEAFARLCEAQLTQTAIPALGLPGLAVTTGLVGRTPVGVQVVAARFREDLCLAAGEIIAEGSPAAQVVTPA